MNAYQAQRIRFGLLAARDTLARDRLTPAQVEDLEGMELVGWRVGNAGTRKAFDRECKKIRRRETFREIRRAAWQAGYWAGVVDERTSEALQMSAYGPNRVNPHGR